MELRYAGPWAATPVSLHAPVALAASIRLAMEGSHLGQFRAALACQMGESLSAVWDEGVLPSSPALWHGCALFSCAPHPLLGAVTQCFFDGWSPSTLDHYQTAFPGHSLFQAPRDLFSYAAVVMWLTPRGASGGHLAALC